MKILNFTNFSTQKFSNPVSNVGVFDNVLPENLRKEIADYSEHLYKSEKMSKNPASPGRYRKRINDTDSECVTSIIKELNEKFSAYNGIPDDKIGNIITYNFDGSSIQPHQDDYGMIQMRMNIIIEKDELSGNPIINGLLYKINRNCGWVFCPSENIHGTTRLKQGIRINLSLGWNYKNIEDYVNAFVSFDS